MSRVQVNLGERSYDIEIGEGQLSRVGEVLKSLGGRGRVAVVTDTHVGPLYAKTVTDSLDDEDFTPRVFTVPAGEPSKCAGELEELWDGFVTFDMDRASTVVALGGGVVGDLAGFAAATYMRGIRVIQVPTTLLASVDSSVGGKTAIDLEAGKNLVGAFHQPAAVLIDPATLRTLPERELRAGLAEVIKHGVIRDAAFFEWLETRIGKLLELDGKLTGEAIKRNCEIKAEVVASDERESGLRAVLNYGHTVGHALETLAGHGGLIHGEAVATGMVVESRVGEALGMTAPDVTGRQKALLERAGLPVTVGDVDTDAVVDTMRHDKKTRGGRLNLVLPVRIGEVKGVEDVNPELVVRALEDSRGE